MSSLPASRVQRNGVMTMTDNKGRVMREISTVKDLGEVLRTPSKPSQPLYSRFAWWRQPSGPVAPAMKMMRPIREKAAGSICAA